MGKSTRLLGIFKRTKRSPKDFSPTLFQHALYEEIKNPSQAVDKKIIYEKEHTLLLDAAQKKREDIFALLLTHGGDIKSQRMMRMDISQNI